MNQNPASTYLRTQIMTASPQELRLMLFGGAIKFCRQAIDALGRKDYEASYTALMRAQKIVLELSTSLNRDMAPDLCDKLSALYTYIYRLLIDANMSRLTKPVEEAIELLEYEQQTWRLLMDRLKEQGEGENPPAVRPPATGAQQTAISSLSKSA